MDRCIGKRPDSDSIILRGEEELTETDSGRKLNRWPPWNEGEATQSIVIPMEPEDPSWGLQGEAAKSNLLRIPWQEKQSWGASGHDQWMIVGPRPCGATVAHLAPSFPEECGLALAPQAPNPHTKPSVPRVASCVFLRETNRAYGAT